MSTLKRTILWLLTYPNTTQFRDALQESGFAQLLTGLSAPTVDATERTVAADTVSFTDAAGAAEYGLVFAVEVTTGGATGAFTIVIDKAPAAGEVKLEYVAGQPKLTFNAADAVTGCKAHWLSTGTHKGNSLAANLARELGVG